jgi:hypothetical protein
MLLGAVNLALMTIVPAVAFAAARDGTALNAGCMNCHGFWACLRCVVCEAVAGMPC